MRGRRPAGRNFVDRFEGSTETKERFKMILDTMYGQVRLVEACAQLNLGATRFHQLREQAVQGALDALAPRAAGRPGRACTPEAERIRELEQALADKELELQQALVRAEIALILPHVVERVERAAGKKTRPRTVKVGKVKPR